MTFIITKSSELLRLILIKGLWQKLVSTGRLFHSSFLVSDLYFIHINEVLFDFSVIPDIGVPRPPTSGEKMYTLPSSLFGPRVPLFLSNLLWRLSVLSILTLEFLYLIGVEVRHLQSQNENRDPHSPLFSEETLK